jgi:hypothetical protein
MDQDLVGRHLRHQCQVGMAHHFEDVALKLVKINKNHGAIQVVVIIHMEVLILEIPVSRAVLAVQCHGSEG